MNRFISDGWDDAMEISSIEEFAGFNPDEPRSHGEWTSGVYMEISPSEHECAPGEWMSDDGETIRFYVIG